MIVKNNPKEIFHIFILYIFATLNLKDHKLQIDEIDLFFYPIFPFSFFSF